MAAPVHHRRELQHVRLHPAGYVERIRADHADTHQPDSSFALRSSDRSASHCGCIMCQSAGWAAMLRANWLAIVCVMTPTSPDDVSTGDEVLNFQPCAVYQLCTTTRSAPVSMANFAEPAGIRVGSPKKSTCTPLRLRSRSAIRQTG